MAIIYSYPDNLNILLTDMLIGTSTVRVAGKKKNITKNFTVEALGKVISDDNPTVWGTIIGNLSDQTDLQLALDSKQNNITLTTIGSNGPSTLIGSILNIPNYVAIEVTKTSELINDGEDGIHPFITAEDIPTQVNSDWNATSGVAEILNKPTKTSDFTNDGADGINPFITAQDIPTTLIFTSPLVNTAGTVTINQSGSTTDGYLNSVDWNTFNTAYNDKINSASVTGTTEKTLTLTQQDGGTITTSWYESGQAVWGQITGTLSNQTDLQNALNLKANDANVVHKTGNENITGIKSFIQIPATRSGLLFDNNDSLFNSIKMYNRVPNDAIEISNFSEGGGILIANTGGFGSRGMSLTNSSNGNALIINNGGIGTGNSGNGIYIINSNTGAMFNGLISSSGPGILLESFTSTTGTPIEYKKESVTKFKVSNAGDVTANKFIKIGGISTEYLMADGTVSTGPILTGYVPYTGATQSVNLGIYNITATKLIKVGGTSNQFLKADGSIDSTGYLSSVGLTMPVAFTVANSPLTANGTIAVSAAGLASQYIRGDGQLATFPTTGGGGSSVFYYLNGSIAANVATYQQMSNTPVVGTGTDFNLTGNGLIAQFLTDSGNPNRIQIPGGAWNFEMFFNISSVGGNTKFYVELLKYDGVTFTSIGSSITVPEEITGGTNIDLYLTSIAVPETVLLTTDRLAIRVYIVDNSGGRTVTLHTEDNTLCQITTTFSAGVTSLNGLTANTQYLAVGTDGSDFNISSVLDTHTFNLPTASSTKRGALSIGDWTAFNNKANASGTINYISKFTGTSSLGNSIVYDDGTKVGIGTISPMYKLDVNGDISLSIGSYYKVGGTNLVNDSQYIPKATTLGYFVNSLIYDNGTNIGIGTTAPTQQLTTTGDAIIRNAYIGYIPAFGINYASFSHATRNGTSDYSLLSENNGATYLNASLVQSIKFRIGNFDKAIIDSNGNFGIGTTIPTQKLHVEGNLKVTGTILDSNNSAGTLGQILSSTSTGTDWVTLSEIAGVDGTGTANYVSKWLDGNTITNSLIYDNGTNVGIGTTSPSVASGLGLVLNGQAEQTRLAFKNNYTGDTSSDGVQFALIAGSSGFIFQNRESDGYFSFETNGNEVFRTNGTNVGIGTTSPTYKLEISDGTRTGVFNPNSALDGFFIGTKEAKPLVLGTADTERMRITSSGNVGIGTTSPANILSIRQSNTSTSTSLELTNTSTGSNITKSAQLLFMLTDTVGTVKPAAYINSFPDNINVIDAYLTFSTRGGDLNPAERMRITSSGNVGIGTTSPGQLLTLGGSVDPQISIVSTTTTGSSEIYFGDTGSVYRGLISYAHNGDSLNFHTAASERMRITSGGNVGIGTTSPSAPLTVVSNSSGNTIRLLGRPGDGYAFTTFRNNLDNSTNGEIGVSDTQNMLFFTGASEKMRITSSGYVGIGTTSPLSLLNIQGSGYFPSKLITLSGAESLRYNANIGTNIINGNSIGLSFGTRSDNVDYDNTLNLHNGNVGIGTTSPSAKLSVFGAIPANTYLLIDNAGSGINYYAANNYHEFQTAGAIRMTITSAGNVGIGTTPSDTLGYGRALDIQGTDGSALYLRSATNSSTVYGLFSYDNNTVRTNIGGIGASNYLRFISGGNEAMRLDTSGNVGIGTTSPAEKLEVNGNILINKGDNGYLSITNGSQLVAALGDLGGGTDGQLVLYDNASNATVVLNGQANSYINSGNVGIGTTSPNSKLSLGEYLGSKLDYINGTNNNIDSNGITVSSSNTSNSGAIGGGLNLTNNVQSVNAFSPVITFSSRSSNNVYNAAYAGIWGIYSGIGGDASWAAGHLAFGTTNAYGINERMRITSGGNVGIGTTSPDNLLSLYNAGGVTNYTPLRLTNGTGAAGANVEILLSAAGNNSGVRLRGEAPGANNQDFSLYVTNSGTLQLTPAIFAQGSSNNVGIGTTTPIYKLDVNGTTNINGGLYASGYVGIGTTMPITKLEVADSMFSPTVRIAYTPMSGYGGGGNIDIVGGFNDFVSGAISWKNGTTLQAQLNYDGNNRIMELTSQQTIAFRTSLMERMRINSMGQVGIGTTAPSAKLHVVGDAIITNVITSVGVYNNLSGGDGNVGISASGEFYRSTSSKKYKKNIQDYTKGLKEIMQIRPVTYNSINESEEGVLYAGLIAEEIHDLGLTEFVQYAEDKTPDALSYSNMVSLLIKAIQEQQKQIEELKRLINK